jgi:hypothetical protein
MSGAVSSAAIRWRGHVHITIVPFSWFLRTGTVVAEPLFEWRESARVAWLLLWVI